MATCYNLPMGPSWEGLVSYHMSSTTGRLAAGQAGLSLPSAFFPLGRGRGRVLRTHLVVQG